MVPWGVFNLFFFCLSVLFTRAFRPRHLRFFRRLFNQTPFWMARLMATFVLGRRPKLWLCKKRWPLCCLILPRPLHQPTFPPPQCHLCSLTKWHTQSPPSPPIHPSIARSLCCFVVGYMVVKHGNFAKITMSVCIWRGNGKICVFVLKMLKGECMCAQCGLKVLCEVTFWFLVC